VLLQTSSLDSFSDLRLSGSCKLDTTDCASHHSAAALLAPARKACESAQEKYVWYSRIISASLIRRKQEPGEPEIRHHRVRGRGPASLYILLLVGASRARCSCGCASISTICGAHDSTQFGFLLSNFLSHLPAKFFTSLSQWSPRSISHSLELHVSQKLTPALSRSRLFYLVLTISKPP